MDIGENSKEELMKILIANDHRGYLFATKLRELLTKDGHEVDHIGCHSNESCDYPDYARSLGMKIAEMTHGTGSDESGVLGIGVCGSGVGIAMALNKIKGIRAVPLWNEHIAEFAKKHNNANVVTFSGDLQEPEEALKLIRIFLGAKFEGGRHQRRIDKIRNLEEHC